MTGVAEGGLQDKLIDKAVFLILIAAGLVVLSKRRANWRSIIGNNKWLFIYFTYLGFSVLWSDDSFTSFKRWIKDAGNVVMVLVILSEEDPVEAVKAFLARYAYLMVPLSVLVIKYHPLISRHYDLWTNQPVFVGVSLGKNLLGMALFVCGLALFWMLTEVCDERVRRKDKTALIGYSVLLVMTAWLLLKAHCATALVCTLLGVGILWSARIPSIRNEVKRLGTYTVGIIALMVLLQVSGLWGVMLSEFANVVGRDSSLHGRSEIWEAVLKEDTNPLIGVGFYSFWSPERNRKLSEEYYYSLGEAHNGYIETYLNSGLIGLVFLVMAIASATQGIKREVLNGAGFGALRLAFLINILINNITESAFDRLVPIWFTFLLVLVSTSVSNGGGRTISQMGTKTRAAVVGQDSAVSPPLVSNPLVKCL